MIHIFKHADGRFDIALVKNGKFIWGSNQHYNRKKGCYIALAATLKEVNWGDPTLHDIIYFQDDTVVIPEVFFISISDHNPTLCDRKPMKKYIPNKK